MAIIYPLLADDAQDYIAYLNAAVIGILAGLGIAIHQDHLTYRVIHNRLPFAIRFSLTALLYTIGFGIIIPGVFLITRSYASSVTLFEYMSSTEFRNFIYHEFAITLVFALILSIILSFSFSMRRHVAGTVLLNMILGTYSTPKEESRVFMSIDLNNSTAIAEKLGENAYFEFINDVYATITPSILGGGGEIYRYVGDQVTITWKLQRWLDPAACVRTYFFSRDALEERAEYFLKEYSIIPSFKAAIHYGRVVVGEIGDVKSQIVLSGDPVYITQEIEKACGIHGYEFLASADFMEIVDLPGIYISREVCAIEFGGRTLSLHTIEEVEAGIEVT